MSYSSSKGRVLDPFSSPYLQPEEPRRREPAEEQEQRFPFRWWASLSDLDWWADRMKEFGVGLLVLICAGIVLFVVIALMAVLISGMGFWSLLVPPLIWITILLGRFTDRTYERHLEKERQQRYSRYGRY